MDTVWKYETNFWYNNILVDYTENCELRKGHTSLVMQQQQLWKNVEIRVDINLYITSLPIFWIVKRIRIVPSAEMIRFIFVFVLPSTIFFANCITYVFVACISTFDHIYIYFNDPCVNISFDWSVRALFCQVIVDSNYH